jgi:hypothetical protein
MLGWVPSKTSCSKFSLPVQLESISSLTGMLSSSDTHAIADIERDLPRLESVCFEFFRSSVLSALAVPDVLESEEPIAINYEQIDKMASDTWSHFETFFRPVSLF